MIKIKICEENAQKINDLIKSAEGKATARTCNYTDVLNLSYVPDMVIITLDSNFRHNADMFKEVV